MTIFYADDNFEDNDRMMTTADLVGMETDDAEVMCGTVESLERCHISSVETSSSSDTTPAATEASSRSEQAGGLKHTVVHKFTSALCSAKSQSGIEKIIRDDESQSRDSIQTSDSRNHRTVDDAGRQTARIMSTPATSASSVSGVHTSFSQSGNYPAATDQIDQRARSHSVSDRTRSNADGSLASLRRLASMSSVVDNTLCLSTAPVEETMASSSLLPDACHTVTEVVLPSAVMSSRMDHAVGRGDVVSFAGRIPVPLHPGSPAAQSGNTPADVALVQVM